MNLQEELKVLKERIAELEEQAKREQEFPQYGDEYWYVYSTGKVSISEWSGFGIEKAMLEIGNVFKTKEQAEFEVEKLKVLVELRKYSRPFESMEDNFSIVLDTSNGSLDIWCRLYSNCQGTIYFESEDKAQKAIETVGEERIKKYIFGVED